MSKYEMTGQQFIENENETRGTYKRMLLYFLFPRLRDYPRSMIFLHDAAPIHCASEVRQYFDTNLPGRWMGRVDRFPGLHALQISPRETNFRGEN